MEYLEYMSEESVVLLKERRKTEVIIELAALAAELGAVNDADDLAEKLFYREQLMSTGLGLGIGLPHVRYEGLRRPLVLMGLQPEGVEDYDSLDNVTVRIVVMILVGPDEHRLHVRLMSQLVGWLKEESVRERLLASKDPAEAWSLLSGSAE